MFQRNSPTNNLMKEDLKKARIKYLKARNLEFWKSWDASQGSTCPFCGDSLKENTKGSRDGKEIIFVRPHFLHKHQDDILRLLEEEEDSKPEEEKGYKCPICGETWIYLGSHVKNVHGLSWSDFQEKYNFHDPKVKVTPSHRQKLSDNKKIYYQSEEGLRRKEVQREFISGKKNPACRLEVREKISEACKGRQIPNFVKEMNSSRMTEYLRSSNATWSRGYTYEFFWRGSYYRVRSTEELLVILSLLKRDITPTYEPCKFQYYQDFTRNYTPDFRINNIFYEVKSNKEQFLDEKYVKCRKVINGAGFELRFLNRELFSEEFGFLPLSEGELQDTIRTLVESDLMKIIKPSSPTYKNYTFLEKVFGKDYDSILKNHEEKFNENKECFYRKKQ